MPILNMRPAKTLARIAIMGLVAGFGLSMLSAPAIAATANDVVAIRMSAQEVEALCPAEQQAMDRAIGEDAAKATADLPDKYDLMFSAVSNIKSGIVEVLRKEALKMGGASIPPTIGADVAASMDPMFAQNDAEERAGKRRHHATDQAMRAYAVCLFDTLYTRSKAAQLAAKDGSRPDAGTGGANSTRNLRWFDQDTDNPYWRGDLALMNKCPHAVLWYTEWVEAKALKDVNSLVGPFIYGGYGWPSWSLGPFPTGLTYAPRETFVNVPLSANSETSISFSDYVKNPKLRRIWILSCDAYAPDNKRAMTMFSTGAPLSDDQRFDCRPNVPPAVRF